MKKKTLLVAVIMLLVMAFSFALVACDTGNSKDNGANKKPIKVNITLKIDGAEDQVITFDGKTLVLPKPTKEGYTFSGWYKEATFKNKFDIDAYIASKNYADITLYAKFEALPPAVVTTYVSFMDGDTLVEKVTCTGETFDLPTAPTKTGKVFDGWYKEATFVNKFEVAKYIADANRADIKVYAKYVNPTTYVSFMDGDTLVEKVTCTGETFDLPTAPTKTGKVFDGWYKEATFVNKFEVAKYIADANRADIKVYAKYVNPTTYVSFMNGETLVEKVTCTGETFDLPADPVVAGKLLDNWYLDKEFTQVFDVATYIADANRADIEVYANMYTSLKEASKDTAKRDAFLTAAYATTYDNVVIGTYADALEAVKDGGKFATYTVNDGGFNIAKNAKMAKMEFVWIADTKNKVLKTNSNAFTTPFPAYMSSMAFTKNYLLEGQIFFSKYSNDVKSLYDLTGAKATIKNGLAFKSDDESILLFKSDVALKDVVIPATTKVIYAGAFAGDNKVNNVTFEQGCVIDSIEYKAFFKNDGLVSLDIPSGIKFIGNQAFAQSGIKDITITGNDLYIDNYAFYYGYGLRNVKLVNVKYIGKQIINGSKIVNLEIVGNDATIEDFAFYNASKLLNVKLDGIVNIGKQAFQACASLASVNLPSSIVTAGDYLFYQSPKVVVNYTADEPSTWSSKWKSNMNASVLRSMELIFNDNLALRDDITRRVVQSTYAMGSAEYESMMAKISSGTLFVIGATPSEVLLNNVVNGKAEGYSIVNNTGLIEYSTPDQQKVQYIWMVDTEAKTITLTTVAAKLGRYNVSKPAEYLESIGFNLYRYGIIDYYYSPDYAYATYVNEMFGLPSIKTGTEVYNMDKTVLLSSTANGVLNIMEGVEKIAPMALYGNENLIGVILPSTLKTIGDRAFYGCRKLAGIDFTAKVGEIGDEAFYGCGAMKDINLPIIDVIGANAFGGNDTLVINARSSAKLPNWDATWYGTATVNYNTAPVDSQDLKTKASDGAKLTELVNKLDALNATVTDPIVATVAEAKALIAQGGAHEGKTLVVGAMYNTGLYGNTFDIDAAAIQDVQFMWSVSTTQLSLTANVIYSPNIATAVKYLNENSDNYYVIEGNFAIRSSVAIVVYPFLGIDAKNVNGMYYGNNDSSILLWVDDMVDAVIPEGVTAIEKRAFVGTSSLRTVTLPSTLKTIGYAAFEGCTGITRVNVTDMRMLAECNNMPLGFTNPTNSLMIGDIYLNGVKVVDLVIPEGTTTIGSGAFAGCKSIHSVTIPSTVVDINAQAFIGCTNLATVTIAEGNLKTIWESAFENCTALTSINIPASVETIMVNAFKGCTNLSSVTFSEGSKLDRVQGSFVGCDKLVSVKLPAGITALQDVFTDCANLTTVIIPSSVEVLSNLLYNCPNAKVYVDGALSMAVPDDLIGNIYYRSDEKPTGELPSGVMGFWHYVDGNITLW